MERFYVCQILWSSFLVLWASQGMTEGNNQDVCREKKDTQETSSLEDFVSEKTDVKESCICLFYPTNRLNCSWSFDTLQNETQLSVHISFCHGDTSVQPPIHSFVERAGSRTLDLQQHAMLYVILQFNMSLHDKWRVFTRTFHMNQHEILSPPQNISAAVKDGGLFVTWGPPNDQTRRQCFEYQLDLGDQEALKVFKGELSYTVPNADPSRTYRVRMRTRKQNTCVEAAQWSEWSPTFTVKQSAYKFNFLLIISISLGIPMILLAMMLLVRHWRLSKLLFPPIPQPPLKYIYFLEKNDTFNFFHPALPPEAGEEITEVEDTE